MHPPLLVGVEYRSPPQPAGLPPACTQAWVPCRTNPGGQPSLPDCCCGGGGVGVAATGGGGRFRLILRRLRSVTYPVLRAVTLMRLAPSLRRTRARKRPPRTRAPFLPTVTRAPGVTRPSTTRVVCIVTLWFSACTRNVSGLGFGGGGGLLACSVSFEHPAIRPPARTKSSAFLTRRHYPRRCAACTLRRQGGSPTSVAPISALDIQPESAQFRAGASVQFGCLLRVILTILDYGDSR